MMPREWPDQNWMRAQDLAGSFTDDKLLNVGRIAAELAAAELAAAEERGRRAEHERATSVIHVLHQCIRGKCACADNGAYSQFACEETARKAIDAWDLAPRDSGKEG